MDTSLTFQQALDAEVKNLQDLFNQVLEYHRRNFLNFMNENSYYNGLRKQIAAREQSIEELKAIWRRVDDLVNPDKI